MVLYEQSLPGDRSEKDAREWSLESKQESPFAQSKFLIQSKFIDGFNRNKASASWMFFCSYPSKFQGILYSPLVLSRFSKVELSYLCSSSRMDRITPEVDGFCCTVAKKVNSLLFRNSWINFSLTWGAAWISLSVSRNQEGRVGEAGGERERNKKKKYRRKKRRGNMRRKRRKDAELKNAMSKRSRLHFSFSPPVNSLFSHPPLHTAAFIRCKTQKCHLCHRAHLSLWQVHNWPVIFWQDTEQTDSVAVNRVRGSPINGALTSENPESSRIQMPFHWLQCHFSHGFRIHLCTIHLGKPVLALYPTEIY